jgi:hypothetical protein
MAEHHITTYSDTMASIADGEGTLIAVMTGPRAHDYAAAFIELPGLIKDIEDALPAIDLDERPSPLTVAAAHLILNMEAFRFGGAKAERPAGGRWGDVPRLEAAP